MMSSPEVPRELAEPRGEPAPALGSAGRSEVLAGEADSVPGAQRLAEDADLAVSLAALSRLSSARLGLEDLLTEVAAGAVRAIPGAEGAGLTLLETDRGDTIVKTAPFVREVDDIQYGLGEGPCISAADTGRTVRSGSLGVDRRWPRFGARVGGLGVHSVLSLPLRTVDGVVGAMNVYAHPRDVFDERVGSPRHRSRAARRRTRFSGVLLLCPVDGLLPVGDAEFLVDAGQVCFDGAFGDVEAVGDGFVR